MEIEVLAEDEEEAVRKVTSEIGYSEDYPRIRRMWISGVKRE